MVNYKRDPFEGNNRESAERFAETYLASDSTDRCCVAFDATTASLGADGLRYFGQLIGVDAGSEIFKTMVAVGERIHDWDLEERSWRWVDILLFSIIDQEEFESLLLAGKHLDAGGTALAIQVLTNIKFRRLQLKFPPTLVDMLDDE
jgi:hypothetical protein